MHHQLAPLVVWILTHHHASFLVPQARDLIIGGFGLHPEYYRFFTRLQSAEGTCGASMIASDMLLTAGHW